MIYNFNDSQLNTNNTVLHFADSLLKPELIGYHKILKELLETDNALFIQQKTRLSVVREINSNKAQEDYFEPITDECDILSDTTSMKSSQLSGSSARTG